MAQVCYPSLLATAEAVHHVLHRLGDVLPRPVQHAGVRVTLENNRPVAADLHSVLGVAEPVEAHNVVPEVADVVEREPRALGEDGHGDGVEAKLLEAGGEVLGDVLQIGLRELLEGFGRVLAGPRIEHHHKLWECGSAELRSYEGVGFQTNLGTGLNLQRQILDANLGNLLENLLRLLGVAVDPALRLGEELRAAALDHVAEQRPRGAAEADQRDAAGQLVPRHGDGLVDVVQLARDVDLLVEDLAVLRVLRGPEGFGEVRALLVDHLDSHAHGLGDHEDVGEDDGGIDQAGEAVDGLEGDLRGDLRVAATREEVAVALGLMVFGEVPAG